VKLHSDILTETDIREALAKAKRRGNVDSLVSFKELDRKGSYKRSVGFEIRLAWYGTKVKGDGRRWSNSGTGGADTSGFYAATYDEWGWFIDELFNADPNMVFGHYKDRETFDTMTRYAYGD
jgi:hypothetical protein